MRNIINIIKEKFIYILCIILILGLFSSTIFLKIENNNLLKNSEKENITLMKAQEPSRIEKIQEDIKRIKEK